MVQRSNGSGLPLEALRELLFGDLDRDDPVQACIARFVNLAHATGADRREDFVRAEFIAGGKCIWVIKPSLADQEEPNFWMPRISGGYPDSSKLSWSCDPDRLR